MAFPLEKTPQRVNVRLHGTGNQFEVLRRLGKEWEPIGRFDNRDDALDLLAGQLEDKQAKWSMNVKIRDGWVCQYCGEVDVKLLESHHIKPKEQFPELADDLENGKCACMWCHAWKGHKDNKPVRDMILARLCVILVLRQFPKRKEECQIN